MEIRDFDRFVFVAVRGEEGIWGEWSEWSGCDSINDTVATRKRQCYTRDTFQVTNVDRCLLIPGNKGDLDIIPCKKFKALMQRKENEMAVLFKKNGNHDKSVNRHDGIELHIL